MNSGSGFIERILCKLFPYTDILRDDDAKDIYLRRWFVYPRNKDFKKLEPRLYIHKFYRGDEDPHLHDHPWKFTSLILTRGYWEETPYNPSDWFDWACGSTSYLEAGEWRTRRFYRRFSILHRPAVWKHRVMLKDEKPVWTLVLTGVKERSWGFWVKNKMCPWRQYGNGSCGASEETAKHNTDVED